MCVKKATKSLSEKNNLTNTSTSGPAMPEDMIGMLSVWQLQKSFDAVRQ